MRFEWTPGFGAGSSVTAEVEGGQAVVSIGVSYPTPGSFEITAAVYNGRVELSSSSLGVRIAGTTLDVDPPGLEDAFLLVPYAFNLVANDIPASVDNVKFTWSFGVGQSGVGSSGTVPAVLGQASTSASHTYTSNGAYGLVADVRDTLTDAVLAQSSVTVFVGPTKQRESALVSCGDWSALQAGGEGVTVDDWGIGNVSEGAVFDIKYEAYDVPDKFLVDYPVGNRVLDSGWRGGSKHNGNALYPGGISGDGTNELYNIFSRLSQDSFRVTVLGPDPGTEW